MNLKINGDVKRMSIRTTDILAGRRLQFGETGALPVAYKKGQGPSSSLVKGSPSANRIHSCERLKKIKPPSTIGRVRQADKRTCLSKVVVRSKSNLNY